MKADTADFFTVYILVPDLLILIQVFRRGSKGVGGISGIGTETCHKRQQRQGKTDKEKANRNFRKRDTKAGNGKASEQIPDAGEECNHYHFHSFHKIPPFESALSNVFFFGKNKGRFRVGVSEDTPGGKRGAEGRERALEPACNKAKDCRNNGKDALHQLNQNNENENRKQGHNRNTEDKGDPFEEKAYSTQHDKSPLKHEVANHDKADSNSKDHCNDDTDSERESRPESTHKGEHWLYSGYQPEE